MKYKLKIPEMIPKEYGSIVEELDEYKDLIEKKRITFYQSTAVLTIDGKAGTYTYEIPKDWLVEVKESPFQKWLNTLPQRILPPEKEKGDWFRARDVFTEGTKHGWNAAIDAVVEFVKNKPNGATWHWSDIANFKEEQ